MATWEIKPSQQRLPASVELAIEAGHEHVIELQGQVEPCLVMMVLFSAATRKVTKVAYAFTCPTAGSQSTRRDEIPSRLRSNILAVARAEAAE